MARRKIKTTKPKRRKLKDTKKKKPNRRKIKEDKPKFNRRKVKKKKTEYPYHFLQDRIDETKKFTAMTLVLVAKDEFGLDLPVENGKTWLRTKVCYQWVRRVKGNDIKQICIDREALLDTPKRLAELKAEDACNDPEASVDGKGGKGKGKGKRKGTGGTNARQLIRDLARGGKSVKEIVKAVAEVLVSEKGLGKKDAKKKALSKVKRVIRQEKL